MDTGALARFATFKTYLESRPPANYAYITEIILNHPDKLAEFAWEQYQKSGRGMVGVRLIEGEYLALQYWTKALDLKTKELMESYVPERDVVLLWEFDNIWYAHITELPYHPHSFAVEK